MWGHTYMGRGRGMRRKRGRKEGRRVRPLNQTSWLRHCTWSNLVCNLRCAWHTEAQLLVDAWDSGTRTSRGWTRQTSKWLPRLASWLRGLVVLSIKVLVNVVEFGIGCLHTGRYSVHPCTPCWLNGGTLYTFTSHILCRCVWLSERLPAFSSPAFLQIVKYVFFSSSAKCLINYPLS